MTDQNTIYPQGKRVSVIIPALEEEEIIEKTLRSVTNQETFFEVIVVDGGSQDHTVEIAKRYGMVIKSPCGRALQMNTGARHARGDVFLFLHADTLLPPGALGKIVEVMKKPEVSLGCFCLDFNSHHFFLKFLSCFTRLNFWWAHYGDQGLFLRRETFEALGGFKDMHIMEDVDLIIRSKPLGRLCVIKDPVITSARRFLKKGIFRQHIWNIFLCLSYFYGIESQRLKKWYKDIR